jgi:hypothetical protein
VQSFTSAGEQRQQSHGPVPRRAIFLIGLRIAQFDGRDCSRHVLVMGSSTDGTITLGAMRTRGMKMLEVACNRCGRRGRLRIARLIAQHGSENYGDLRKLIVHDCPRMQDPSVSIYERCGVMFPELPKWFL